MILRVAVLGRRAKPYAGIHRIEDRVEQRDIARREEGLLLGDDRRSRVASSAGRDRSVQGEPVDSGADRARGRSLGVRLALRARDGEHHADEEVDALPESAPIGSAIHVPPRSPGGR